MPLSSTARFNLFLLLILAILTTYAACGGRDLIGDVRELFSEWFGPKTTRERYRDALLERDELSEEELAAWDAAYTVLRSTPLRVEVPHRETMHLGAAPPYSASGFTLHLPPGRLLRIRGRSDSLTLFAELHRRAGDRDRPLAQWTAGQPELSYETDAPAGEDLVFRFQGPYDAPVRCDITVITEPVIAFPVAGYDERAIQSFWGAPRDGGRRLHEGNDVFAPRGTDLVAVTDGRISRVNNGGLGGKTVWLRDLDRGLSYYYAHLEEQLVSRGQSVRRGDVVGTVGNTGNARTTPPHLHFGIYAGSAIDPYPFLQDADAPPPASALPLDAPAAAAQVPGRGKHYLRLTPARDGEVIRQLDNGEAVVLLGKTGVFYRIATERNEIGYANFDL